MPTLKVLHACGFESGILDGDNTSIEGYGDANTMTIVGSYTHSGLYAFRVQGNGVSGYYGCARYGDSYSAPYGMIAPFGLYGLSHVFHWMPRQSQTGPQRIWELVLVDWSIGLYLRYESSKKIRVYRGTTLLAETTGIFGINQLHKIELQINTSAIGSYAIRFNESETLSGSVSFGSVFQMFGRCGMSALESSSPYDYYYDDIFAFEGLTYASGTLMNFCKDVTGNGTHQAWTNGYTSVADRPHNGDTDYVWTTVPGAAESVLTESGYLAGVQNGDTILAVSGVAWCAKAPGATAALRVGLVQRTITAWNDADIDVGPTDYYFLQYMRRQNPETAQDWLPADLDYTQGAVKSNNTASVRCTAMYVMIALLRGAADTTPPATVTDLTVNAFTGATADLQWRAPGDDGYGNGPAGEYDFRFRTDGTITDANWGTSTELTGEPTPGTPNQIQTWQVTGLTAGLHYWIAMKTRDPDGNSSALSNVVNFTTPGADTTPPAAATLTITTRTQTTEKLTWFAPGDDNWTGQAVEYDLRIATSAITSDLLFNAATRVLGVPPPRPANSPESFVVGGLLPNTLYYFALKTKDDAGNWSALSNSPGGQTLVQTGGVRRFSLPGYSEAPSCTWKGRYGSFTAFYFATYQWAATDPTGDSMKLTLWRLYEGTPTQIWQTTPNNAPQNMTYVVSAADGADMNGLACLMVHAPKNESGFDYHQKFLLVKNFQSPSFWTGFLDGSNILYMSRRPFTHMTWNDRDDTIWFSHYGYNRLWFAKSGSVGLADIYQTVPGDKTLASQICFSPFTNYSVYGVSAGNLLRTNGAAPQQGNHWLWSFARALSPRIDLAQLDGMNRNEVLRQIAEVADYICAWDPRASFAFQKRVLSDPKDWVLPDDATFASIRKRWLRKETYNRVECTPYVPQYDPPKVTYRAVSVDEDNQPIKAEIFNGDIHVRQTGRETRRVIFTCVVGNKAKFGETTPEITTTWWTIFCPTAPQPWATDASGLRNLNYTGGWWNAGSFNVWLKLANAPASPDAPAIGFSAGDQIIVDCPGLRAAQRSEMKTFAQDASATPDSKVRTLTIDNKLVTPSRAQNLCNLYLAAYKNKARQLTGESELFPSYRPLQSMQISVARLFVSNLVGFLREVAHDLFGSKKTTVVLREWEPPAAPSPQPLGMPIEPGVEVDESVDGGAGAPPPVPPQQGPSAGPPEGGIVDA